MELAIVTGKKSVFETGVESDTDTGLESVFGTGLELPFWPEVVIVVNGSLPETHT